MEEAIYYVEKILDHRIRAGSLEYLIKWLNYPDSENSWQKLGDLDCAVLLKEYEEERTKKAKGRERRRTNVVSSTKKVKKPVKKKRKRSVKENKIGFDRNLEPEKIIGAADVSGELMFVINWKGTDQTDLVSAKDANIKCPQIVIQFYEEFYATDASGELLFVMKWKGTDEADLVRAKDANKKCPQIVIQFYEERLT